MAKTLILDHGLFVNLAGRLARDQEVAYYSSWQNAFPTSREFAPGSGIKNVERVDDPIQFMLSGKASAVYVPDLYLNDLEHLARKLEIPVAGACDGNGLETDRWFLKEFLEREGHPVIKSVELHGTEDLRDYLQKHEDKYVKVSVFRGDMETFHHINWRSTSVWWADLARRLGPIGEKVRFIIEDPIPDAIELGLDGFFINGRLAPYPIIGCENKDAAYMGVICQNQQDDVPEQAKAILHSIAGHCGDYCNFFSNEMRITKDGTIYMTDATCRIPSPPGGVMMTAMRNFPKFMRGLAEDNVVEPDWDDTRYLAEIILNSDWVSKNYLEVSYPPELEERVAFHNYCKIDGKTWVIPHDSQYVQFGSALGWGKTRQQAKDMALETVKEIEAYQLTYDVDALEKAEEELVKGGELGFPV